MAARKWRMGDLALYRGGITCDDDLTEGNIYVVNNVSLAHDTTYLQVITDEAKVRDLLARHFIVVKK